MRNAFAQELSAIAARDDRVVLLSGDIGNRLFDDFKARFPDRFYNCGVAEANMVSVGAGMAMSGLVPICYTIAPFLTYRAMEQIRIDLCYHHVPVILVGVGAGLSYASLGATHHSCEDLAMLRSLPHMRIVCPGDAHEVRGALRAAVALGEPCYVRIGKKGEPAVHAAPPAFEIGRGIVVAEGTEACLLATGNLLPAAVEAGRLLGESGISTRVVSFHTVKPLDHSLLEDAFRRYPVVATIEEHSRVGGLGAAVAEWLADRRERPRARLVRIATPDDFVHEAGSQEHYREILGLEPGAIRDRVRSALGEEQS